MNIKCLLSRYGFHRTKTCAPMMRFYKATWKEKFNYHQERINVIKPKSIVISDSIAGGLARYPEVWLLYYKNALNLGIGGDRVEHVLWRVENLDLSSSIQDVVL